MKYTKQQIYEAISYWKRELAEEMKLGKNHELAEIDGKSIRHKDIVDACMKRVQLNIAYVYARNDGCMIIGYYVTTAADAGKRKDSDVDIFCVSGDELENGGLKTLSDAESKDLIEDYKADRKENGKDSLKRWVKYTF